MEWSFCNMETKQNKKEKIKSIGKALDLLEFLSDNELEIGIADISKKLNMSPSTVHRIITFLNSRGYVIKNQKTAKYRLGIKLFELGCTVQSTKNLIETIKPYLLQLSKSINETSNLAILESKEVIYIAKSESSEMLTTNIKIGTRLPAHCTALGKVMLAYLSDGEFNQLYGSNEPVMSLTSRSISSLDELKKELKKVKEQGYALDKEESIIGIHCVAVPIFYQPKEAIAAISITGPASRFTIDKMEDTKGKLIAIVKEISKSFYKI